MQSNENPAVDSGGQPPVGVLAKLEKFWTDAENVIAATFLGLGILLMFYQVLSRYFFGFSLYWTEEIVRYLSIWSSFIGASIIARTDEHVNVTFFIEKLNDSRRTVINQLMNVVCGSYSLFLMITGIVLVSQAYTNNATADSRLATPMFLPYLIMPIAGLLITLRFVQKIKNNKMPEGWLKDRYTYVFLAILAALFVFVYLSTSPVYVMLVGMFVLMFMGAPIGFSMGFMASLVLYKFQIIGFASIASKQFWAINSFTLLAIPFFIFAGSIVAKTPMGNYIIDFSVYLFKKIHGGVGIAVLVAAVIFAAMSGSSVATAATLAMVALPMLRKAGYPDTLSTGMVGAGGALSIIPPNTTLVIFGAISGTSIAALFTAGIAPGLALCVIFSIYVYIKARKGNYGVVAKDDPFVFSEAFGLFKKALLAMIIPIIILGSIYSGLTTPTEAAVFASVYAIVVSLFVYRIKPKVIYAVLKKSVELSAMIFFIIMSSGLFGFIISIERVPQALFNLVTSQNIGPVGFLMLMNLLVPVLGFFLGPAAILIMLVPILMPICTQLGINPVHLGIILALSMEMDFVMPPLGTNLYVLSGAAKVPVGTVIKGVLPFIVMMFIALLLLTIFPQISLFAIS